MKTLDFLYFDAGGGHRAAANALRQVVERQGKPWDVRLVNLQELLDELDVFRKLTGFRLQDLYNLMLKRGWTLGSPQLMVGMHAVIRAFHSRQVRLLRSFWQKSRPDAVVSLVPNFNRALGESLARELPGIPLITILTDLADYPPHFWLEPVEQFIICGTDHAVEQAAAMGHSRQRIFRVSGMILNPHFYDLPPISREDRAAARAALGFDAAQPVGLVLFGGQGSAEMLDIARRLDNRQLLMICGHNTRLAGRLGHLPRSAAMFVEGFTQEVPRYMQLADYFIGKPGPGSISEAIHMHLPVIVEANAWTLPQERFNPRWIREHGLGIVLKDYRKIQQAVEELIKPSNYARYREATCKFVNRGVFEIVEIVESILRE